MFDVFWTDPKRETVGQRKTRKEQQGTNGRKTPILSRGTSIRSSNSSGLNLGHTKPSLLNFFGGGRKETTRAEYHATLTDVLAQESIQVSRTLSDHTAKSSTEQRTSGAIPRIPECSIFEENSSYHSDADLSARSDVSGSVFSGWTGRSAKTESTWGSSSIIESITGSGKFVQPLNETSFVTQSTEVVLSTRESVKAADQVATVVHISGAGAAPIRSPKSLSRASSLIFDFPIPNSSPPESPATTVSVDINGHHVKWPITQRTQPSYSWKPPETWACDVAAEPKNPSPKIFTMPVRLKRSKRPQRPPSEVVHLQKNLRRMEAASPKIILERLKEEWIEVADASVYRELELEKQLWMLSALRTLKSKNSLVDKLEPPLLGQAKILSLYENHASSSSLAALTTASEVHHLATSPLSAKSYPNVHPLAVSGPTSRLPYDSGIFNAIHAISISSLFPAASLPLLLKECHRTLTSAPTLQFLTSPESVPLSTSPGTSSSPLIGRGGKLHLTILDPSPLPATLGPRLRDWLDNHLILNLERQFRCINSSRLFPVWLADAGLRAEGSTIVSVRFLASSTPSSLQAAGSTEECENTKSELKSVVGRMLWKEMWGSYVQANRWWWEDESIVEECERMGTMWEYSVIEAVKEG